MGSKKANKKKRDKSSESSKPPRDSDSGGGGGGSEIITDARFASVHSDSRFQKVRKHKAKVEIDSRFDHIFKDKSFGSSAAPVDKRGKPKKKQDSQSFLRHYYRIEESKDEEKQGEESEEEEAEEEERKDGQWRSAVEMSQRPSRVVSWRRTKRRRMNGRARNRTRRKMKTSCFVWNLMMNLKLRRNIYQKLRRKPTDLLLLTWIGAMLRPLTCI